MQSIVEKLSKRSIKSLDGTFDIVETIEYNGTKKVLLNLYLNVLVQQFTSYLSENIVFKNHISRNGEISLQQFAERFYKFYYNNIFQEVLAPIVKTNSIIYLEIKTSKKNAKYIYAIVYFLPRLFCGYSNISFISPSPILLTSKNKYFHENISNVIFNAIYRKGYTDIVDRSIDLTIVDKLNKNLKTIIIFQKKYSKVCNDIINFYQFIQKKLFSDDIYNTISIFLD